MEVQCQKLANQYTMLNRILIHLERFHYIAACSDTLTTAGFHRKSNTESQQLGILSNLIADVVIGRHLYIYIPFPCISRVGNRFARQKRLFLQFQFTSCSVFTTEAGRQHAGNRLWDLFWASNRLLVSAGVMVFACWLVLFACAYA